MVAPNEQTATQEIDLKVFQENLPKNCFFELFDGKLRVNGVDLLSNVPDNVFFSNFGVIRPISNVPLSLFKQVESRSFKGGFLGFKQEESSSRLINSLGKFCGRNFVSIFRFKSWWSTMSIGTSGSDLQMETQWVLLDVPELKSYVLILPIIEDKFRAALHPGEDGHVLLCAESGSTKVKSSSLNAIAYVHISDNPYNLMKEAYSAVRVHLDTFKLLEEKSVAPLINKFGWCTWDAFYLTVDPISVWNGLKDFVNGGIQPRFLVIDDGWQSVSIDGQNPMEDAKNLVIGGTQMTSRLYRFEECDKFRRYKKGTLLGSTMPFFDPIRPKIVIAKAIELEKAEKDLNKAVQSGVTQLSDFEAKINRLRDELTKMLGGNEDDKLSNKGNEGIMSCIGKNEDYGMKAFTKDLRKSFKGLDDIYVWHALCGAWGGVRPGATHLESKVIPVTVSPGLDGTMNDLAVIKIVEGGIGLVHPDQAFDFFDSMHSYLAESGITGVKVDVMHTLEYVCEEYGGRVDLAKVYYKGLSESLVKNFNGTGLISSMQQCNDFFFLGTSQISLGRVGDDFWFQDPSGDRMGVYWLQGVHMIHCAYNSLWMGQIIQPDWDMFQSDHLCAKFHAGSRAICGGPVYVSDSVGGHNFNLIKSLFFEMEPFPNVYISALPTRDTIFKNPLFDGQSPLKIWNLNKFGGVIGAFNCQGAGWDRKEQRIKGYPQCYKPITCSVHVNDIEWDQKNETTWMSRSKEYAVYLDQSQEIFIINSESDPIYLKIQPSSFELLSFVPVKNLSFDLKFAPIGLINMFNSGGTILRVEYCDVMDEISVEIHVKGEGEFLAYSNNKPDKSFLNGFEHEIEWFSDGRLKLCVPWNEETGTSKLRFMF